MDAPRPCPAAQPPPGIVPAAIAPSRCHLPALNHRELLVRPVDQRLATMDGEVDQRSHVPDCATVDPDNRLATADTPDMRKARSRTELINAVNAPSPLREYGILVRTATLAGFAAAES